MAPFADSNAHRAVFPAFCALCVTLAACKPEPSTDPGQVEEDRAAGVQDPHATGGTDEQAEAEAAKAEAAERAKQQAKVEAATRRIIQEVARARGLEVTGEFVVELIGKAGVRDFVKEAMYEELSAEEIQLLGRVDASFGVLPVGSDGEQVLLDMYELGILGIYDPKKKTLLIGDYVDRAQLGMVVGHEGAHGLQDMHFDLEAINHMHRGHSDLDTAQTFLVEGDAQAAYLAWVAGDEGLASIGDDLLRLQSDLVLQLNDSMGIPHPILARQMQMPYTDGTMNVVRLARDEGWAAVDALYEDMPTTSEQMLHLDKLAVREPAIPLRIDTAPLLAVTPGHAAVWEDELGEATILSMLADVAAPHAARAAAAGWGGDRFVAFEHETDPAAAPLLVGVIVWDSVAEAKEFEPVFRDYLEQRKPGEFLLERKGAKVLYATHFAEALADAKPGPAKALSKAAWSAFTVDKSKSKAKNRSKR